jgi:hypothetical protein
LPCRGEQQCDVAADKRSKLQLLLVERFVRNVRGRLALRGRPGRNGEGCDSSKESAAGEIRHHSS